MTDDTRPAPKEIAEAQILELRFASRAKLGHEIARVRLALADLEAAVLAALVQAAAVAMLERAASGHADKVPNVRELVSLAIAGRLGEPLAPYLEGIAGEWSDGTGWAEDQLRALSTPEAPSDGAGTL